VNDDNLSLKAETEAIFSELQERWPDLFNFSKPVPLAVGIVDKLLVEMPHYRKARLHTVITRWCRNRIYRKALVPGASRYGLNGVEGIVTEEQAAFAIQTIAAAIRAMRAKRKSKRKARKAHELQRTQAAERKAEIAAKLEAKKKLEEEIQAKKTKSQTPSRPKPAGKNQPVITIKKKPKFSLDSNT
jgi:sRNA-binding protein